MFRGKWDVEKYEQLRNELLYDQEWPLDRFDVNGELWADYCFYCEAESFLLVCDGCFGSEIDEIKSFSDEKKMTYRFSDVIRYRFTPTPRQVTLVQKNACAKIREEWVHPGNRGDIWIKYSTARLGEDLWREKHEQSWNTLTYAASIPGKNHGFMGLKYTPGWSPRAQLDEIKQDFVLGIQEMWRGAIILSLDAALTRGRAANNPHAWAESVGFRWEPLAAIPQLPSREITPREAEEYASGVLLYLGEPNPKVTQQSNDGGVDVVSENCVTQVKHVMTPVGPAVVRELYGVSIAADKKAIVMSRSGFTKAAIDFADQVGVYLFQYEPHLEPLSERAREAFNRGLRNT